MLARSAIRRSFAVAISVTVPPRFFHIGPAATPCCMRARAPCQHNRRPPRLCSQVPDVRHDVHRHRRTAAHALGHCAPDEATPAASDLEQEPEGELSSPSLRSSRLTDPVNGWWSSNWGETGTPWAPTTAVSHWAWRPFPAAAGCVSRGGSAQRGSPLLGGVDGLAAGVGGPGGAGAAPGSAGPQACPDQPCLRVNNLLISSFRRFRRCSRRVGLWLIDCRTRTGRPPRPRKAIACGIPKAGPLGRAADDPGGVADRDRCRRPHPNAAHACHRASRCHPPHLLKPPTTRPRRPELGACLRTGGRQTHQPIPENLCQSR